MLDEFDEARHALAKQSVAHLVHDALRDYLDRNRDFSRGPPRLFGAVHQIGGIALCCEIHGASFVGPPLRFLLLSEAS